MFTTAGKTLATAKTAGSAAGSAWAKHNVDFAKAHSARRISARQLFPCVPIRESASNEAASALSTCRARCSCRRPWRQVLNSANEDIGSYNTCCSVQSSESKCAMRTNIAARANLDLIDQNYARWQEDPASVDPSWAAFFEGFELGNLPQKNGAAVAAPRAPVRES